MTNNIQQCWLINHGNLKEDFGVKELTDIKTGIKGIKLNGPHFLNDKGNKNGSASQFMTIKEGDLILHRGKNDEKLKEFQNKYLGISIVEKVYNDGEGETERLICKVTNFYLFKKPIQSKNINNITQVYGSILKPKHLHYIEDIKKSLIENNDYKGEEKITLLINTIKGLSNKIYTKSFQLENFINNHIKKLTIKYFGYLFLFLTGIGIIISINIDLFLKGTEYTNFLNKGIYLSMIEFLILYISYHFFNLSNKYLKIIEIYKSYQLLYKVKEWADLEIIGDEEFKKENIRKFFEIQNIVERSFDKRQDNKMPMSEMLDFIQRYKNIIK